MANPTSTPKPESVDRSSEAIELMAEILRQQAANAPRRRLTYAEYAAKQPKHEMPFPVFQNGYKIFATQLPKDALELLPKLQEGRFFNRRIHVWRDSTPDRAWHIDYPSRQLTDRMTMSTYGGDIVAILKRLTTETPDIT
jgi:hypothetical protein